MSNYIYPQDRMQVHCIPGYPVKQTWKLVTDERVLKIYQRAVARCVALAGWKAQTRPQNCIVLRG